MPEIPGRPLEPERWPTVDKEEPGGVLDPPEDPPGFLLSIEAIVRNEKAKRSYDVRSHDVRLHDLGEALRTSWQTPTDTMITDDLPTLLTLLSKVPKHRNRP